MVPRGAHDASVRQSGGSFDLSSSCRTMLNPFEEYALHLTCTMPFLHPSSAMFGRYYNTGEANTGKKLGTNDDVEVDMCNPRPRWCPTHEQKEILESIFEWGSRTPSRQLIVEIAAHLNKYGNVGEANVFYWFQNRKARAKRKACAGNSHEENIEVKSQTDRKRRRRAAVVPNNTPLVNILNTKDVSHVIANKITAASIPQSSTLFQNLSTTTSTKNPSSSSSSSSCRYISSSLNLAQEESEATPVEMERYLSPLHLQPAFLDDGCNHLIQDNSAAQEMADYYQVPDPPIPAGLTTNNAQVAGSVDDFLLWDDMLAVALFTGS